MAQSKRDQATGHLPLMKMLTDYKFWYIKNDGFGAIEECAVRYFEGDITTVDEPDEDNNLVPVTCYRRTKRVNPREMDHTKSKRIKKDSGGNDCVIYTRADFGVITTDDELRTFVNKEMEKDTRGNNIPEQA